MSTVGAGRKAVALGGGTGLPVVIGCLLELGFETSAVVTMADDGGSTGILRRELGMLPPGDVRNCLAAMAEDRELAEVFQYRFPSGEGLAGHALGNLILAALNDIEGDFPAAIEAAGRRLRVRGKVYPSTVDDVVLHAVDRSGKPVSGQARIAHSTVAVATVEMEPACPAAYPPAVAALGAADVITIGPGSLYTSIIPNVLVPGIAEALRSSTGRRVCICNVANLRGETRGLGAVDQVKALVDHGLEGCLDVVVVHRFAEEERCAVYDAVHDEVEPVCAADADIDLLRSLVPEVVVADLASGEEQWRHDQHQLLRVLEEVVA